MLQRQLTSSAHDSVSLEEIAAAIGKLPAVLEDPRETHVLARNEEGRRNDELMGVVRDLDVKLGQSSSPAALSAIAEWVTLEDQGDVAHACPVT